MIFHLVVGDLDYIPTKEELSKIVEEFQKPMPVFTVPVKVHEVAKDYMDRIILHIGTPDWTPTQEEVEEIRTKFKEAQLESGPGVVATRVGVKASRTYQLEKGISNE